MTAANATNPRTAINAENMCARDRGNLMFGILGLVTRSQGSLLPGVQFLNLDLEEFVDSESEGDQ